jgi:hypothetical protein
MTTRRETDAWENPTCSTVGPQVPTRQESRFSVDIGAISAKYAENLNFEQFCFLGEKHFFDLGDVLFSHFVEFFLAPFEIVA